MKWYRFFNGRERIQNVRQSNDADSGRIVFRAAACDAFAACNTPFHHAGQKRRRLVLLIDSAQLIVAGNGLLK
jgi:hypothetical protein